jgi:hypothetical protein
MLDIFNDRERPQLVLNVPLQIVGTVGIVIVAAVLMTDTK